MQNYYIQGSDSSFLKKLVLIVIFFTLTPIALVSSVISLVSIANSNTGAVLGQSSNVLQSIKHGVQVYASLPSEFPSISGEVVGTDARGEIVRNYLEYYNSPLEPYAEFIVTTADKYKLDYRFITAIAQKESNLGKKMPHEDCNNAWGYGIHSKGTLCFDTWEEGIETVSRGLKENYIDEGYVTPEDIMSKYTPLSPGSWAEGVIQFMQEMK